MATGRDLPGFEHWHELAEQADTVILVGGAAFAFTVLLTRRGLGSPGPDGGRTGVG